MVVLGVASRPLLQVQARLGVRLVLLLCAWLHLVLVLTQLEKVALIRSFPAGCPVLSCQLPGTAWHLLHQKLCPGTVRPCVLRL
jgi:hypothetical protein